MSTYGLRIENPSGVLVVDADGSGHTYRGRATLSVAQTRTLTGGVVSAINPFQFTWTAASASIIPLLAVGLVTGQLFSIVDATQAGSTWTVNVFGFFQGSSDTGSSGSFTGVTPTIYAFEPGVNSGTYGMRLMNSSSAVTYDFASVPLNIIEALNFPSRIGAKYGNATATGDWAYKSSDSQTRSSTSANYAVVGTCDGQCETYWNATADEDIFFQYGWCLEAGALSRIRFYVNDNRPALVAGGDTDTRIDRFLSLYACTALLLDTTYLT